MSINLGSFFLGVLHVIQGIDNVVHPVVQIAAEIPSPIQPFATTLLAAMQAFEGLLPQSGKGPIRKQLVTTVVNDQHPTVDTATLGALIDELVSTGNAFQAALAKVQAVQG